MTDLLPCVEINPENATHSIIWLHGLGADGHDFEPIVAELSLNQTVRFVFPHAPEIPVSVNNGMTMPAWYDICSAQINLQQDALGIKKSQDAILSLINSELERGMTSDHIILAGFSQGGAIALHTALRYDKPLAGIMGLSTYLPLEDTVKTEQHGANKNTAIFLAHGDVDPIIPYALAESTKQSLSNLGYQSELKKYPMEHSVCADEIDDISDWINQQFSN